MASEKKPSKASKAAKSDEEILSEFQTLRNEQRMMANKLSEMELELNEHKYESINLYACCAFPRESYRCKYFNSLK